MFKEDAPKGGWLNHYRKQVYDQPRDQCMISHVIGV